MNSPSWIVASLAAAALLFLEWRRASRLHLLLRLLATACAVAALTGLLAARSEEHAPSATLMEAALWTRGSAPAAEGLPATRFALLDAAGSAPADTTILPDVGTLRRRLPTLATLHVLGDGLDAAELPKLAGLRVVFHSSSPPPSRPLVSFLHAPRALPLGQPLEVTGRVVGLSPGTSLSLSMKAPDGRTVEAATAPADADGRADFALRSPALPATGQYLWQLRCGDVEEPVGVAVTAPALPRVLVLEGSPRFDTAALRHWYEAAGGTLAVRTRVGKDTQHFASSLKEALSFDTVDGALLAGYDLLLTDGKALSGLGRPELAALATAVEKTGLGLLILADDTLPPSPGKPLPAELAALFPWKFSPTDADTPNEEHPVRPHWPGQEEIPADPILAAPLFVTAAPDQTPLIDDRHGHIVASSVRRGAAQIAVTLLHDTARWQRVNTPAAFATYWSFLFSRLARPADETKGRWQIGGDDGGPLFVDHPVELAWLGPPGHEPGATTLTSLPDGDATPLPLAQSAAEPGHWGGTFWPTHPGWHRIESQSGAAFPFYVHSAGSWPALQANRRRVATERFAAESAAQPSSPAASRPPLPPGWWYALFLLAAGYLWTERRFSR